MGKVTGVMLSQSLPRKRKNLLINLPFLVLFFFFECMAERLFNFSTRDGWTSHSWMVMQQGIRALSLLHRTQALGDIVGDTLGQKGFLRRRPQKPRGFGDTTPPFSTTAAEMALMFLNIRLESLDLRVLMSFMIL